MPKNSAQARRAHKSREPSQAVTHPVSPPILNGAPAERPVTSKQLADHLGCTTRTLANYRRDRIIPYWKVTQRRIMYRISDVEACLALRNI
jgi:hypothetical protein